MSQSSKSIAELLIQHQMNWRLLAERSGIDDQRVMAIVLGRYTPSPQDRDAIAAVFGLTRDDIAWGHKTPIQHIYGQGPG
jgi:transcriptional regulator with XRE-family HTH domain